MGRWLRRHGDLRRPCVLRSIVVAPNQRRQGVGRRIVELLLMNASSWGVRRAFLLTANAQAYFEGLGFAVVDRNNAPPAILATRQAAELCPVSAVLMAKGVSIPRQSRGL